MALARPLLLLCAAAALALAASPGEADAKRRKHKWFRYVVHFTCGTHSGAPAQVVAGDYTTAIHVLNPHESETRLKARLALTDPPGMGVPGYVSSQARESLDALEAAELDCGALALLPALDPDLPALPAFVQGFVTLESERPISVRVLHSATDAAGEVEVQHEPVAGERVVSRQRF
jgi:hypothetical protein